MMKRLLTCGTLIFLVAVTFVVVLPMTATALDQSVKVNNTTVSIESSTSSACENFSIMINTDVVAGIGSATIFVSYDPAIIKLNSVAGGDIGTVVYNDAGGMITMTAYDATKCPTGSIKFADLEFCPVGSGCSDLDIDVSELVDCNVDPIIPDIITDGKFCINGSDPPEKEDIQKPTTPTVGIFPTMIIFIIALLIRHRRK